jgi:hypothetical protein
MRREIENYDGPRAGYLTAGNRLRELDDPEAILALADSALLLSLGPTPKAAEYAKLTEARESRIAA